MKAEYIELLAPAGTFDVLKADVAAGADAVYLGGKLFNMRMHRSEFNFDNAALKEAVNYTRAHGVKLYVTVNNLINEIELPVMQEYLAFLDSIAPDALIVQDLATLYLAKKMQLSVPLHASIMLNTHSTEAIKLLQNEGITRVVVGHQLTLPELSLLRQETDIELEYFIHGDMCLSYSGSCYHSGILFGLSSNRGRCLKPCRWPFQLINHTTGEIVEPTKGPYKFALKDMCMYQHLPELIQAGVTCFKIEGRMRTADYVANIVSTYRNAIDRYLSDSQSYQLDMNTWDKLNTNRVRNFTTCYALGRDHKSLVDYSGKREPRLFSQATVEPEVLQTPPVSPTKTINEDNLSLAVRVKDLPALRQVILNGADTVYIGGEVFKPDTAWTITDISAAANFAAEHNKKVVLTTPRITKQRELSELRELLKHIAHLNINGLMVSNLGTLSLAQEFNLPIYGDFSLNLFNHAAAQWLKDHKVIQATISLEAAWSEAASLAENSKLPLELIVHGSLEAMLMDFCPISAELPTQHNLCQTLCRETYSFIDECGQKHAIKTDQYCRTHILFTKDLCLIPYLAKIHHLGIKHFRLECNHYDADTAGKVTKVYYQELQKLRNNPETYTYDSSILSLLEQISPKALSSGIFRHSNSQ